MKSGKYKIGGQIILVPQEEIYPNPNQPRKRFDFDELESLAQSIRQNGIIQPIAVRVNSRGEYELISGERRLRASRLVGMAQIPCIIMEASDEKSALFALLENIQRSDLGFFEEAQAIEKLIDDFGMSRDEVCKKLGKAPPTISNKLRLLRLPDEVQEMVKNNLISPGHARALLGFENQELIIQAAKRIVKEDLSVREVETLVKNSQKAPKVPKQQKRDKFFSEVELALVENLGRKVKIKESKKDSGVLEIEFFDKDDLESLAMKLENYGK